MEFFCLQGWNNVFYMLITADVLAAIVSVYFQLTEVTAYNSTIVSPTVFLRSFYEIVSCG